MGCDEFIAKPPKYDDKYKYSTQRNHLALWEIKYNFGSLLKILKDLNECANISKSSSSYDISTRGGCIRTFIGRLEKDGYLYESVLFKKLIGKNNRFYTSPNRLIHLLDKNQFNILQKLINTDYFQNTFIFSRKDEISFLELHIRKEKK